MKFYSVFAILLLAIIALILFGVNSKSETQRSMTNSLNGGGITCQVICNGECPQAPFGYTLSESKGQSGSLSISGGAAGRCFNGQDQSEVGTETMCCYFSAS